MAYGKNRGQEILFNHNLTFSEFLGTTGLVGVVRIEA
jgi:hypothetical protein